LTVLSYNIEGLTLEYHYCQDQSLKNYIIEKNKCLNNFLANTDIDIICIQEYTPILNITSNNYYCVKQKPYAIFFRKGKLKYIEHHIDKARGLVVRLAIDEFIFYVGTNRLVPSHDGIDERKKLMTQIDDSGKDNIMIYALDTNMRKKEDESLNHLTDCFYIASEIVGKYTYDKKTNPYFNGDDKKITQTRYDKIFISDTFTCEKLAVIELQKNDLLVHPVYPFGGISDHYPIMATLVIE